ncbi:hypothetical protein BDV41DRAFT_515873 [Aspergillus transmontanensis]|uniref:Uncharacterized protein n=1 Tax=Aspergillus transmontanensis TaxID=1034304 RepID=A0A5N6VI07_9EURO|nr:hypothetical protein BDV41DRAFT_515873 [Aspergillus transmontanensis]
MVNIAVSHTAARGSIPRIGINFCFAEISHILLIVSLSNLLCRLFGSVQSIDPLPFLPSPFVTSLEMSLDHPPSLWNSNRPATCCTSISRRVGNSWLYRIDVGTRRSLQSHPCH